MGVAYAVSMSLLIWDRADPNTFAGVAGGLGLLLGPPLVHVANDNPGAMGLSFGMRALFVGTGVVWAQHCLLIDIFGSGGGASQSTSCDLLGAGLLLELLAMPAIDFSLAHHTVERSGPRISLVALPPTASRPAAVMLTGRF
jgi:hypothetical protein